MERGKLVEVVTCKIKEFKEIYNIMLKRIQFVDVLERRYLDLNPLGMEDELGNFNIIGIKESKLHHAVSLYDCSSEQKKHSAIT